MTQTSTLPMKKEIATHEIVRDIAEQVAPHSSRVVKHSEAHDYERSEKKLTVTLVKSEDGQGILDYSGVKVASNGGVEEEE